MKVKTVLNTVLILASSAVLAQTPQPAELPLTNSVIKTIQGDLIPEHQELTPLKAGAQAPSSPLQSVPESCRFSLSLAPGQKAVEARAVSEIQINRTDNTCEGQFEVGEPSQEELDTLMKPSVGEVPAANSGENLATNAVPDSANFSSSRAQNSLIPCCGGGGGPVTSAGFAKSWFTTILGTVTTGQANVAWTWDGSSVCVKPVSNTGTASGGGAGFSITSFQRLASFSCSESTTAINMTSFNPHAPICFFHSVTLKFSPLQVHGLQSGTLTGSVNWFVSNCAPFFTNHFVVVRTQN
jgi:hypothetical protein